MRDVNYDESRRLDVFIALLRTFVEERRAGTLLVIALQEVSHTHAERARALAREFHGAAVTSEYAPFAELRDGKRHKNFKWPPVIPEHVMLLAFDDAPLDNVEILSSNAAFASSSGNGYVTLLVPTRQIAFVSTHVSYGGERRRSQLAELSAVAHHMLWMSGATACFVTGDFNCTLETLRCQWPPVTRPAPDENLIAPTCEIYGAPAPTRIGKFGASSFAAAETIDHVVVLADNEGSVTGRRHALHVARVVEIDTMMLSDHRPVMYLFE